MGGAAPFLASANKSAECGTLDLCRRLAALRAWRLELLLERGGKDNSKYTEEQFSDKQNSRFYTCI